MEAEKEFPRKYLWHTMLEKFLRILAIEDTCFLVEHPHKKGKQVLVKKTLFDLSRLHPADFQSLPNKIHCHLSENEIDKAKCLSDQKPGTCQTCEALTFGLKIEEAGVEVLTEEKAEVLVEKKTGNPIEVKEIKIVNRPPKTPQKTKHCRFCLRLIKKGEKCCFKHLSKLPRVAYTTNASELVIKGRQTKRSNRKEKLAIEQLATKIERAVVRLEDELKRIEPLLNRYRAIIKEIKDERQI